MRALNLDTSGDLNKWGLREIRVALILMSLPKCGSSSTALPLRPTRGGRGRVVERIPINIGTLTAIERDVLAAFAYETELGAIQHQPSAPVRDHNDRGQGRE